MVVSPIWNKHTQITVNSITQKYLKSYQIKDCQSSNVPKWHRLKGGTPEKINECIICSQKINFVTNLRVNRFRIFPVIPINATTIWKLCTSLQLQDSWRLTMITPETALSSLILGSGGILPLFSLQNSLKVVPITTQPSFIHFRQNFNCSRFRPSAKTNWSHLAKQRGVPKKQWLKHVWTPNNKRGQWQMRTVLSSLNCNF